MLWFAGLRGAMAFALALRNTGLSINESLVQFSTGTMLIYSRNGFYANFKPPLNATIKIVFEVTYIRFL